MPRRLSRPFSLLAVVAACAGCAAPRAGPGSAPPFPASAGPAVLLREMRGEGTVEGGIARVRIEVDGTALAPGWQRLPLFPAEIALEDAEASGDPAAPVVRPAADGYEMWVAGPGRFRVALATVARVREEEEGFSLPLPFLPALRSAHRVRLPGRDLRVWTEPSLGVAVSPEGDRTSVLVFRGAGPAAALRWAPRDAKAAPAAFVAEQDALYTIGRGSLRVDAGLAVRAIRGRLRDLSVEVAPSLGLADVRGEGLRAWRVEDEGGRRFVRISLAEEAPRRASLLLSLEQPLEGFPIARLDLPRVEVVGAEREKGTVAVAARKGIQVEALEARDLARAEPQEVPAAAGKGAPEIHLAFRYLRRPFSLALRAGEVAPKVSVEAVSIARVGRDAVRLSSALHYAIREAGVYRLRLRLDPSARLVDVQCPLLSHWQAGPDGLIAVDLRSKVEGFLRLDVEAERPVRAGEAAEIPRLEALDVEREAGQVAIVALPGVRVDPGEATGIRQVNPQDLPPPPPGETVALAYRYLKHPWRLRVQPGEILPEVAVEGRLRASADDKAVSLEADLSYTVQRAGVFSVRLRPSPGLRVTSVEGEGLDDWRVEGDGTVEAVLRQRAEGTFRLAVRGEQPVADPTGPFPIPSIGTQGARKETGWLEVRVDPALRGKVERLERLREIDLKDLPGGAGAREGTLAFRYLDAGWSLALSAERVRPRVTADAFHFVTIGEKEIAAAVTVRYRVLYAGVSAFRLRLPRGVRHLDLAGEGVKAREEAPGPEGSVWTVRLHAPRTGTFDLHATFAQPIPGTGTVAVPYGGVRVLDVEQETGWVLLAARPDAETTIADDGLEGLAPIDEREVPADLKAGITVPALAAFRYLAHPWRMSIRVEPHAGADVVVAIVEACRIGTALSRDGGAVTDVAMSVRNTSQQYLSIGLPAKARIHHLFVAGLPETALTDGARTLVPIGRAGRGDAPFEVRLRYEAKGEPLGRLGRLSLAAPPLDLEILRLGWSVSLPRGYRVVADGGTLDPVDGFEPRLAALDPEAPLPAAPAPPPAPSPEAGAASANRWAEEALRPAAGIEAPAAGGRAAGLPSMPPSPAPRGAEPRHYQALIPLGGAGTLRIEYARSSVGDVGAGALLLALAGLSLGLLRRRRPSDGAKASILLSLAVVVAGVRILAEGDYEAPLEIAFATLACAGLLAAARIAWERVRRAGARPGLQSRLLHAPPRD